MQIKSCYTWLEIWPVRKGPAEFQSMYGQGGYTKVDLPIVFCTAILSDAPCSTSTPGYSQQHRSVYFDCRKVSSMSEYNNLVKRIPLATLSVWMVESSNFFSSLLASWYWFILQVPCCQAIHFDNNLAILHVHFLYFMHVIYL